MADARSDIIVLAGVNGAGKSSVAGRALKSLGGDYYDPDEATRAYQDYGLSLPEANSRAWHRGRLQLERAIRDGHAYAFETTLGGRTVTRMLLEAAALGRPVRVWYVGLVSAELHMARVRARVERGGHDIPEARIRERWTSSRENLVRLLPHLSQLRLFDNSATVAVTEGEPPVPTPLLDLEGGRARLHVDPGDMPGWARPIVEAALRHSP
jgi:predicted ABC-type ATPase